MGNNIYPVKSTCISTQMYAFTAITNFPICIHFVLLYDSNYSGGSHSISLKLSDYFLPLYVLYWRNNLI